jgi:hypothetical protein
MFWWDVFVLRVSLLNGNVNLKLKTSINISVKKKWYDIYIMPGFCLVWRSTKENRLTVIIKSSMIIQLSAVKRNGKYWKIILDI